MANDYLNIVWNMKGERAERRLVLLALADYADKDGLCYPSLMQISERCLISKEAASRIISRFIALGYISRISGGSGRGHNSEYQIHKDALKVDPATTIKEVLKVDAESTIEDEKVDPEKVFSEPQRLIQNGIKVDPGPGPIRKNHHEPPIKNKYKDMSEGKRIKHENVSDIFIYWQSKLGHPTATLTNLRKRRILQCLKTHSLEQIKLAIDGCAGSPWHRGENDRGETYDDIELICRNDTKLEGFIARAEKAKLNGGANGSIRSKVAGSGSGSTPQAGSSRFGGTEF